MKPRRLTIFASTLVVAILLLLAFAAGSVMAIEQATPSAIEALPVINDFESGPPAGTDPSDDMTSSSTPWPTITFDSSAVAYTLTGFGGAEDSTVVVDPTNSANMVARVVKSATAQV